MSDSVHMPRHLKVGADIGFDKQEVGSVEQVGDVLHATSYEVVEERIPQRRRA